MKYALWFVRLVFVAWMLPAGVNHFVPLFPQLLGNMPLSRELFAALFDSHLFDLVKAVELFAGIAVLTGFHMPLALLLCMPVSFCVWYWDTPLQGWGSISSIYGWGVLIGNTLLCLAYLPSYRAMLTPLPIPHLPAPLDRKALLVALRVVFGGWMLVNGLNFFMQFYPTAVGSQPLAIQLMTALEHSQLLDVAMGVQAVTGALILGGLFVPLALCVSMPICVCAAYWAVILEHEPAGALLALLAVALNALLMLAYLHVYRDMLVRRATALGEGDAPYESRYVDIGGRIAQADFALALIPLALAALFYHRLIYGRTADWCMLVLLLPAVVLYARRVQDMGRTGWLLLAPAVPVAAAVWLHMFSPGANYERGVILAALAVSALVTLWGLIGRSRTETPAT